MTNRRSTFTQLILISLLFTLNLFAQNSEINQHENSGLKMNFPSIYFKPYSTDYAAMPYQVNKCFEYIAVNFKSNVNSLVIWRDSSESEKLTNERIKKLNKELRRFTHTKKIEIHSMGNQQKISRQTINSVSDTLTINYLQSLNAVFDMSKTRIPNVTKKKIRPHLVWTGWKHGFHWSTPG